MSISGMKNNSQIDNFNKTRPAYFASHGHVGYEQCSKAVIESWCAKYLNSLSEWRACFGEVHGPNKESLPLSVTKRLSWVNFIYKPVFEIVGISENIAY